MPAEAARVHECPSFEARVGEVGHHLVRPVVDWSTALAGRLVDREIRRLLLQAIDQLLPMDDL
jgi:hypothetical protein